MSEYLTQYAEPIPDGLVPDREFYIPHHCTAVGTKFRVVLTAMLGLSEIR